MEIKRRTQEERSAATRDALISAARRLWGLRGYTEVGTPEIAKEAGVTRGAMYHQFADKAALFSEVVETVEQDVMARMATMVAASGAKTPADAIRAAVDAWLEVSADPEVRQLILLDAPSVLGWPAFRDVAQRYSLGMTEQLLTEAIRAGQLARQPTRPLAHVLIGALDEAAMVIATADDPNGCGGRPGKCCTGSSTGCCLTRRADADTKGNSSDNSRCRGERRGRLGAFAPTRGVGRHRRRRDPRASGIVTLEEPADPASSPRIVQVPEGNPDLAGRNVVVIVDDGPQWFRLRSLTVRGVAKAVGDCTYRVVPERIVAWDYGSLREVPTSPGTSDSTTGVVFGCRRQGRRSPVPLTESGSGASQLASHDSCEPFTQGNAIRGTAVVRPSSRPHLYDDLGFVVDGT